ncbi:hypothetical protein ACIQB5_19225 [Streptomyces sp. NPDC088560]|uniref:hypothetical protein n=1 Tax=Streptomyces sp. NPDC088560 TaxID=3365868 RepID=UPI0037F5591A
MGGSIMTTRRTRRTARTARSAALVAVAAAAALSLTACQGGAKDAATGSGKKVSSSPSASRPAGSGDAPSNAEAGVPMSTTTAHRSGTAPASGTGKASPVRTRTLVDGSKAEIYELGTQHYRAKIVHGGEVLATLETNQHDAGLDANDMFVVLTLDGQIHSWMGGGHQAPGTFKLAGGWTAKVTKLGDDRYRAQILGNDGAVDGTLDANQHDVGLDANGVYVVLSFGGVISAHM